eukprot:g34509.t1
MLYDSMKEGQIVMNNKPLTGPLLRLVDGHLGQAQEQTHEKALRQVCPTPRRVPMITKEWVKERKSLISTLHILDLILNSPDTINHAVTSAAPADAVDVTSTAKATDSTAFTDNTTSAADADYITSTNAADHITTSTSAHATIPIQVLIPETLSSPTPSPSPSPKPCQTINNLITSGDLLCIASNLIVRQPSTAHFHLLPEIYKLDFPGYVEQSLFRRITGTIPHLFLCYIDG